MSDVELETSNVEAVAPEMSQSEIDNFFDTKGGEMDADNDAKEEAETEQEQSDGAASDEGEEPAQQPANETQRYKAMADEERIKRKETQKQIDLLKQENQQFKDTFNRIMSKAEEQKQAAEAPSFEDDPIAALKYENDQLRKEVRGVQQENQQTRQQIEISNKQQEFVNTYRAQANQFKASNPDFDDAYNYLLESRMEEYEAAGYEPAQAEQLALEDEAAIAANHLGKGSNPAAAIYKLAQLRGFKQKSTVNNQAQDQIKANEQKIQNLERGLKASKSVNSGGSNPAREKLSLESIANMDDKEFSQLDWDEVVKMG